MEVSYSSGTNSAVEDPFGAVINTLPPLDTKIRTIEVYCTYLLKFLIEKLGLTKPTPTENVLMLVKALTYKEVVEDVASIWELQNDCVFTHALFRLHCELLGTTRDLDWNEIQLRFPLKFFDMYTSKFCFYGDAFEDYEELIEDETPEWPEMTKLQLEYDKEVEEMSFIQQPTSIPDLFNKNRLPDEIYVYAVDNETCENWFKRTNTAHPNFYRNGFQRLVSCTQSPILFRRVLDMRYNDFMNGSYSDLSTDFRTPVLFMALMHSDHGALFEFDSPCNALWGKYSKYHFTSILDEYMMGFLNKESLNDDDNTRTTYNEGSADIEEVMTYVAKNVRIFDEKKDDEDDDDYDDNIEYPNDVAFISTWMYATLRFGDVNCTPQKLASIFSKLSVSIFIPMKFHQLAIDNPILCKLYSTWSHVRLKRANMFLQGLGIPGDTTEMICKLAIGDQYTDNTDTKPIKRMKNKRKRRKQSLTKELAAMSLR